MSILFMEPSTRTRSSFEVAMKLLGGSVLNLENTANTSIAKGESLSDTVKMVSNYSDIIVMRLSEKVNYYMNNPKLVYISEQNLMKTVNLGLSSWPYS